MEGCTRVLEEMTAGCSDNIDHTPVLDGTYHRQTVPELKTAYRAYDRIGYLVDAEKSEYINTRPFKDYFGAERVAILHWLRREMPLIKYMLMASDARELLCNETELHAKVELSTALSNAIEGLANCYTLWSKTDECPRSYRLSCSFTKEDGSQGKLWAYTKYENCD